MSREAATARSASAPGRLRGFAAYGITRMVVEVLSGLRGLVLAAILGPEVFGIWALFRIALTYCGSAGLGVLRGLEVEASAPRPVEGAGPDAARAEWQVSPISPRWASSLRTANGCCRSLPGALVLNLTLALAALAGGLGLEGLAAAMLLGRTVYASAIVVAAARGSGMADWPALLAQILLPLIWCAGVVWILGVAPVDGAIGGLATFVVYVLALLPLVPFGRVVLRGLRQSAPSEAGRG